MLKFVARFVHLFHRIYPVIIWRKISALFNSIIFFYFSKVRTNRHRMVVGRKITVIDSGSSCSHIFVVDIFNVLQVEQKREKQTHNYVEINKRARRHEEATNVACEREKR